MVYSQAEARAAAEMLADEKLVRRTCPPMNCAACMPSL
jgi:hypothetical protein